MVPALHPLRLVSVLFLFAMVAVFNGERTALSLYPKRTVLGRGRGRSTKNSRKYKVKEIKSRKKMEIIYE